MANLAPVSDCRSRPQAKSRALSGVGRGPEIRQLRAVLRRSAVDRDRSLRFAQRETLFESDDVLVPRWKQATADGELRQLSDRWCDACALVVASG
jgi:hypothetical protein